MKRFLAFVFSLLFLIIAAALIIPSFIDWSAYKDQAAQVVREKTGMDMDIGGSVGFSIIPTPRFVIEKAALNDVGDGDKPSIAAFERLEVNLELVPLLSKQVKVSSLTLVKPQITIEKLKNRKLNVMTPEVEALSAAHKDPKIPSAPTQSAAYDISLDEIRVKDGVFVYTDQAAGSKTKVQNINMDLSAKSLFGPYEAQGSAFYEGRALNIDAKVGRYDAENKLILPKIRLELQPGDIIVDYDGVVSLGGEGGVSLQGQTKIYADDVTKTLSGFGLEPNQSGIKSGDFNAKGLLTADAKGLSYKNIELSQNDQILKAGALIKFVPFSYDLTVNTPKDKNIDLSALTTKSYGFKKARINFEVAGDATKASIKSASVALDNTSIGLSGSYEPKKNGRPYLSINTKLSRLDYDKLTSKVSKKSGSSSHGIGATQSNNNNAGLPIDLDITTSIDELVWQKKTLKGIKAKAKMAHNRVTIESLSVQDIGKAKLKISGEVKDFSDLTGITVYVDLSSPDIKALAKWFAIDTSAWPKKIKKAGVKAKATGSSKALDITTNITSMDAKLIASGKVITPFKTPAIKDLELQIKHKNMAQAIQLLSGATVKDVNLQKPLDFYAKVSQEGKAYSLNSIKGNLSGITVEGSAKLDLSGKTPDIKADLDFGSVTLQSVVNKNANVSNKPRRQNRTSGTQRWSKQAINTSAFHVANLDIDVSAKQINYGAWPLGAPQMSLKLKNGVLNISDLSANVFGGQVSASSKVQVANEVRAPLYFESTSAFKDADLGKLSKALIGTKLVNISGTGSVDLTLRSSGVSPAALVFDLSGQGKVNGTDILLDGVDVAKFVRALSDETKPGDTLVGLWKGSTKGGQTQFETLDGAFTIQNGVVSIPSMILNGQTAKVETTGQVDLPRWTLSTKHPMSVKAKDGEGNDVPPFEIEFSGSLDNPSQTFGQGLLQNYLQRKIQRKLDKLLGGRRNNRNTNTAPSGTGAPPNQSSGSNMNSNPQPAPPQDPEEALKDAAEDALKGVLEGLLR